ncbi:unnamed protein product (macronuclear) [Paramecium tetraurelia]|uniref:Uncharacterized protein n=1 Tax=Paramecium tetraurelia TaxID=5888 RepID=A0CQI6_PARTE|nr:uncharacterized protein GSPATT00009401001 [Paramecium tetraurelia]CAK73053.1 unnamed protein product [Paramecium tetraurelia]|eukprot:XP_001440450.1 hypothetical protein (macronuclear) [Paramecium tetraurelia strain d4-2]
MWNLISINPICQKKKLVSDQERLLLNCRNMKKTINNGEPWKPSHSLSKVNNKYNHCNQIYINSQRGGEQNHAPKQHLAIQNDGYIETQFEKLEFWIITIIIITCEQSKPKKIREIQNHQENQKFLSRLQSASSIYNKNYWQPDNEKKQIYKQIILKRTKLNQDFNDLARKSLESRSTGRMLSCNDISLFKQPNNLSGDRCLMNNSNSNNRQNDLTFTHFQYFYLNKINFHLIS